MESTTGKISPEEKPRVRERKTKKESAKSFKRLRPLIVVVVMSYILFSFGGLQIKKYQVNAQITVLEEERVQLLEEQQRLLLQKEKMDDPVYIERRAREALGLIKPGEMIILPAETGEAIPLRIEGMDDIRD